MADREFDLGDVLSMTTGRLLSPRGMEGIYDIAKHLAGESVWTHQLPRIMDEAKPVILARHPQLTGIGETDEVGGDGALDAWLAALKARLGDTLPIASLTADQHESIDPLSELAEKVHPSKIIVVQP